MAKRMLIDATHPEETRVVVLNGNRLEEFDFESSTKKQVKGNIYLAKITRVEPSLQAAFVDYGGNRHGFLAFSEIHPDYYRIPVGDRDVAGGEPVADEFSAAEAFGDTGEEAGVALEAVLPEPVQIPKASAAVDDDGAEGEAAPEDRAEDTDAAGDHQPHLAPAEPARSDLPWHDPEPAWQIAPALWDAPVSGEAAPETGEPGDDGTAAAFRADTDGSLSVVDSPLTSDERDDGAVGFAEPAETVETIGGDDIEEAEHHRSRVVRHYKIQEVIKRRQIMLVQVTKEERGNKGAALTTYLSLAGRYCVLMPNTGRGGGVSRKITSLGDRRRLKDILEDLDLPEGMGVIVRTAGAERSKAEIKRDYEYLLRLWNEIRELTLRSTAPALIYEEGNLIKRSIRDLYARDIDDVLVEGEEGYRTAKAFMKMLMPSHAKRVQPYRDPHIGLLHRFQVESQIDAIHSPIVQLRSGGYVVINQTEALVAIDVNSGRSTRERNIEETAVRTNIEAAEEIARQLRLRDLAGLIVIDFIDMEEHRNQVAVERRLKEAMKADRARIQVGRISPFGLLEMSRQRLRPSLVETSTQPCPHCGGTGFIRSTESTALYVLRSIEEEGIRRRSAEICLYVPTTVALYILNQKRESLAQIEARYSIRVLVARDDSLIPPAFRLERLRAFEPGEVPTAAPTPLTQAVMLDAEEDEDEEEEDAQEGAEAALPAAERRAGNGEEERGRRRRRRRRRPGHEERATEVKEKPKAKAAETPQAPAPAADEEADAEPPRRGGRARGRRRRGRREPGQAAEHAQQAQRAESRPAADTIEVVPTFESEPQPAADRLEVLQTFESEADPWPAPAIVETPPSWFESNREAAELETASLPALAGNGAEPPQPQPRPEPDPSPPTAEAVAGVPFDSEREAEWPLSQPRSAADHPAPPPDPEPTQAEPEPETEHWPQTPNTADHPPPLPEPEPARAEPEPILAAAGPPSEAPSAPSLPPEVHQITEKPANPRRGWWQRFMPP